MYSDLKYVYINTEDAEMPSSREVIRKKIPQMSPAQKQYFEDFVFFMGSCDFMGRNHSNFESEICQAIKHKVFHLKSTINKVSRLRLPSSS